MKKLVKSYKFWSALAGAVGLLFIAINDTLGISINAGGVEQIILAVCGILVVFGVVKMPSNKEGQHEVNNQEEESKHE